jgi:hypothetical protein
MVVQSYLGFEYSNQIDMPYVDVLKGPHPYWSELLEKRRHWTLDLQSLLNE